MTDVNAFLLGIKYCFFSSDKHFETVFLSGEVFRGISLHLLLERGNFVCIDISQGSAVTRLRRGGIYKYAFIAHLMISLRLKEFRKSVNIFRSYEQDYGVLFFLTHSAY